MEFAERISDLLRPDAFPHPVRDIRLVETHISWVLLAGDFVYKLRKPVNFGFLDFSTIERRRADCAAEVALNRRLCADLYLGVVDVVERADGHLYLGGPGVAIEPAVKMRRLPDSGMLPNLLENGECDARLVQRIARQLAEFHARAATGPGVDEYGSLDALHANWDENFSQTQTQTQTQTRTGLIDSSKRDAIRTYVNRFTADNTALLEQRMRTGRIRDGHGDLHAASVCIARRRLYLFDCIEFNRRFRCADVAADVAFLAMDLEHLGRADLAAAFVEAYVRYSGDAELPLLMRFYKCYRAFVRGKVLALRLAEPNLDAHTAAHIVRTAKSYFDLAFAYASPLSQPVLVVTMGLPASGKTTLARALASRLGVVHLSSDVTRKHLVGLRANVRTTDAFEGGMYTRAMTRRTYTVLRRKAARWLRRGQSAVLDATYGQPSERAAVRQLARRTGALLYVIVCRADEAVVQSRLLARRADPRSTSDARPEIWPALTAAFVEPSASLVAFEADTTQPTEVLAEQILAAIYALQPRLVEAHAA
jgi:aminoglycoside phosphotransferase family enzyme/predicted kinase